MRRNLPLLLALGLLTAISIAAARAEPALPHTKWAIGTLRFPHDPYDIARYAELGQWSKTDLVPYRDYLAEYPPLPVALFGALQALSGTPRSFVALFTLVAALGAAGTYLVVHRLLQARGRSPWWLLVLALPASLYFAVNRFDALAALPLVAGVGALLHRRYALAGALLGLGVGVKFFPAVLAPVFLAAELTDPDRRAAWWRSGFLWWFAAVCAASYVLPGILWGGVNVVAPIYHQLVRFPTVGSLLSSVTLPFTLSATAGIVRTLRLVFTALTIVPIVLSFALPLPRTDPERAQSLLVRISAVLLVTVLLNPFFSPQFVWWFVPILVLLEVRPAPPWVALLLMLDLVTFAQFPLVFDLVGPITRSTIAVALVRSCAFLATLAVMVLPRRGEGARG